ncbi:hypothetical protein PMAYCL1PPCAC_08708 [Pristionchus mayeri]|uniref:TFIIS N-terminal domain-containing protein n=1 Tax=Pristionchus mayeri TaxID=1317129 RepID=A0AAN4ZC94_9BILA|nr:hypothetical protein PMAYCL1PPCAC_08708 [Pristionchus mayeri]
MVACAVAASAVHPSSSVVGGGGERRAPPLASPEVSRAALQPPKAGAMAYTPAASIEQLKQQLQTAIENKDSEKATLAIEELERVTLCREILESTRIGLYVNTARKDIGDLWPPLAKRCRGLIKAWQKLCETSSSSASTSRNGTPSLVSPAVGRRLTPHTPANKRITPGVASERASNLSPANGSYAPKAASNLLSPGLVMHKSHSVGFDLKDENGGGGVRNGKRKQDEPVASSTPSSTIKRAKTTASDLARLTSPATPATPSLIETRRAAVLSTADLVSQLTSNLPQNLGFENAAKAHEEKVKRELEDQQLAAALANGGEPAQSPYVFDKKRKYERKKPLAGNPSTPLHSSGASASSSSTTTVRIVTPPPDERKGGLVLKLSLSRTTTDTGSLAQQAATPATSLDKKEEKERRKKEKREAALHASKSAPALGVLLEESASSSRASPAPPAASSSMATSSWSQETTSSSSSSMSSSSIEGGVEKKKEKIDWFAMVPSIEELQKKVEKDKERRRVLEGIKDSEKAYTLHVGDRVVLALPYIEIDDRPDFLKFNYPDPGRFYAEENFIGGLMERPVHPTAAATPAAAIPAAAAAGQK